MVKKTKKLGTDVPVDLYDSFKLAVILEYGFIQGSTRKALIKAVTMYIEKVKNSK